MPVINQLPSVSSSEVTSSDLLPVYNNTNGDARKLSLANLLEWFRTNFTNPAFTTDLQTPGDGFNITLTQDSKNYWLLLRPTSALATGTIVLPAPSVATDGQEVLVTTTLQIASFTVNGNGATAVYGAPSVLAAEDKFKLRYNTQTTSWYLVA